MSFAKLVTLFKNGIAEPKSPERQQHNPLRLATAAVLLDIAHADGDFTPAEDSDMAGYLTRAFSLSDDDAKELVESADELRAKMIDHFALTNFIRKNASLHDRIEIVKTMWRIVYSDNRLTDYENYLVRKLADLLGIEHHVMIEAKVAVLNERGLAAR